MAEDDDSWIYDSVVGFLNSPIWMVPIESFVDQNCLGFALNYERSNVALFLFKMFYFSYPVMLHPMTGAKVFIYHRRHIYVGHNLGNRKNGNTTKYVPRFHLVCTIFPDPWLVNLITS